ncbi:MAG: hypothetical protein H7A51_05035 [Akkermansiaceae bacterium]|nr:hypothetical protein [Akkermansiaceae bacterium]
MSRSIDGMLHAVMKFSKTILLSIGVTMLLGACASEQTVTKTQVKKDAWGRDERYTVGKDKDGNPVMKSDRRSSLEGKQSNIAAGRDFQGKDYSTKSYRKKRWGGNTFFARKKYEGNTDASQYKKEPWFVQKQAAAAGQRAQADGKSYAVNPFKKSTAGEQGATRIAHTQDAETQVRRRVYKQPEITNWKDQKGLSVKDTNRMLGR